MATGKNTNGKQKYPAGLATERSGSGVVSTSVAFMAVFASVPSLAGALCGIPTALRSLHPSSRRAKKPLGSLLPRTDSDSRVRTNLGLLNGIKLSAMSICTHTTNPRSEKSGLADGTTRTDITMEVGLDHRRNDVKQMPDPRDSDSHEHDSSGWTTPNRPPSRRKSG